MAAVKKSKKQTVTADELEEMLKAAEQNPGKRRRTLWQVESNYHCSVIGTCLSRQDLRQLARKKTLGIEPGWDDFRVHTLLTRDAANRSDRTRLVTKYLDSKYLLTVKRYAKADSTEAIRRLWREDITSGEIPAAYWAIMTHPLTDIALANEIYGDCHMLSFDGFSRNRREQSRMRRLEQENLKHQAAITLGRERLKTAQQEAAEQQRAAKNAEARLARVVREIATLQEENRLLRDKVAGDSAAHRVERLEEQLAAAENRRARLEGEQHRLTALLAATRENASRQEKVIYSLRRGNERQRQEILSLEALLNRKAPQPTLTTLGGAPCDSCADQADCTCRRPDLCGKTVLYVGGRANMVAQYRQLVEECGGTFAHHDGGQEHSRQLLPKLLSGADAVLCPVDCVSHDACRCVKKICKRYRKPFVMMRSSGLSSFAKSLETITTD
jgi:hypothetical protein